MYSMCLFCVCSGFRAYDSNCAAQFTYVKYYPSSCNPYTTSGATQYEMVTCNGKYMCDCVYVCIYVYILWFT